MSPTATTATLLARPASATLAFGLSLNRLRTAEFGLFYGENGNIRLRENGAVTTAAT